MVAQTIGFEPSWEMSDCVVVGQLVRTHTESETNDGRRFKSAHTRATHATPQIPVGKTEDHGRSSTLMESLKSQASRTVWLLSESEGELH